MDRFLHKTINVVLCVVTVYIAARIGNESVPLWGITLAVMVGFIFRRISRDV